MKGSDNRKEQSLANPKRLSTLSLCLFYFCSQVHFGKSILFESRCIIKKADMSFFFVYLISTLSYYLRGVDSKPRSTYYTKHL
jgi:hypothetical protein